MLLANSNRILLMSGEIKTMAFKDKRLGVLGHIVKRSV